MIVDETAEPEDDPVLAPYRKLVLSNIALSHSWNQPGYLAHPKHYNPLISYAIT
ncbi:hypothetical protein AM1_B0034 (plasmid) [Acaryochloris marina MBIC11017]|uniref:Uncharacterized protein n=1 Tax=Acaryochloris marina (strain MBIC 11017) TaxID=329726 RepID=A8ZLZ1_ACAM1|nr:hypothetical protein AM1_B0034 [Acaryochloris marina MBIC11017]BDM83041.1 hypothetical protein AM10699_59020 [Acaryochloris marina MBIC10699]